MWTNKLTKLMSLPRYVLKLMNEHRTLLPPEEHLPLCRMMDSIAA